MRKKVRGLRSIEKEILAELEQLQPESEELTSEHSIYAASIVLDYCEKEEEFSMTIMEAH